MNKRPIEQAHLWGPAVPEAFAREWSRLERVTCLRPVALACLDLSDDGGGYLTFEILVDARKHRLVRRSDDASLVEAARQVWALNGRPS